MEAANLGAYLRRHDVAVLDEALGLLATVPGYRLGRRLGPARVRRARPVADGGGSLGVPTWFYGHEPPNAFAAQVAKYFKNAIREDVLLHVCSAGVVFLPGRGGTVQEVFQDACENYYAEPAAVAPMVLVGVGLLDPRAAGVAAAAHAGARPRHGGRGAPRGRRVRGGAAAHPG